MSNNILNKTYRCKITLRIKDKTRDDKKYQAEPFVIFYHLLKTFSTNTLTISGSNCVPAHLFSSAIASCLLFILL